MAASPEEELPDIEKLPDELIFEYMLKLDPRSLQNACRINKRYAEICNDQHFWKKKIDIDYKDYYIPSCEGDYKKCWIRLYQGTMFKFDLIVGVISKTSVINRFGKKRTLNIDRYEELIKSDPVLISRLKHYIPAYYKFIRAKYNKVVDGSRLSEDFAFKFDPTNSTVTFIFSKSNVVSSSSGSNSSSSGTVRTVTGVMKSNKVKGTSDRKFNKSEQDFIFNTIVTDLFPRDPSFIKGYSEYYETLADKKLYYTREDIKINDLDHSDNEMDRAENDLEVSEDRFLMIVEDKEFYLDKRRYIPNDGEWIVKLLEQVD